MDEWIKILLGGGIGGSLLTAGFTKLLSRRKDTADAGKAEADAVTAALAAVAAADEQVEKARKNGEAWYDALVAVRAETDAKVEAAIASYRKENAELHITVASMAKQLDQRTIDQAEVELARRRNQRYDQLEAENVTLRDQVKEIPALRKEVADLRIEVADLRTQLGEAQREQRLDHELLRDTLNEGDLNG
jgi:predicted RNase H-like nuclease (RuvC/YqgF family)